MANQAIEDNGYDINEEALIDENANKYLTFLSDSLVYGINIENVIEIITEYSITTLPKVPNYVKGIMNLRGQIIPVVDIREKMGKSPLQQTSESCIIILEVDSISVGILVDTVLQVINVEKKITSPPSKNQEFVSGITNLPDGTVMFCLDCELLVDTK